MANGVIALSSNDSRLESRIVWSSSSNGSSANTSNVYADLQVRRTDNYTTKGTWSGSLFIHDEQQDYSNPSTSVSSSWITMKSFTKYNVPHNHNGTGSCHIWGNVSAPSGTSMAGAYAEVDTWVTLDTIPRDLSITGFSVKSKTINTAVISWSTSDPRSSTHFLLKKGDTVIENWTGSATYGENVASDQKSGTFNIKNLSPNTTYKLKIKCTRADSGFETVSSEISFTTYDYAKLSSVPNVNIGSAHTITWTNPSGATTSLKLCKTDNSSIIDYGTVTGTSKSLTPTASTIYALTPNSNTYKARYILTTTQNGKTYTNSKDFDFKVTNSNPIFSNFEYQDNNSTTIALTGNNKKLIRYYSGVKAIISTTNKAVAQNSATMKLYRLIVGDKQSEKAFSSTQAVELNVYNIENSIINVYAIDSRTNTTNKQISPLNFILYNKITINAVSAERGSGGIGKNVTLRYNGTFWNSNFGAKNNSITSIKYYYRLAGTTNSWTLGGTVLSPTISGNSFSQSVNIQGDLAGEGFSQDNSFDIKLVVYDELMKTEQSNNTFIYTLGAGTPLLAYHKNGIAIGQKYDRSVNAKLQVAGGINIPNGSSNEPYNSYQIGGEPVIRYTGDATIISGKGSIYLRPNGTTDDAGQVFVDTNGNVGIKGNLDVPNKSFLRGGLYSYEVGNAETPIGNGTLIIKRVNNKEAPNNGVVLEYGNSKTWAGQLYIGDNATQGIYYNGWSNGNRGSWRRLADEPITLYDNSSGSNGTITLSETAANFSYLEIYFGDSKLEAINSVKVFSPNGKTVSTTVCTKSGTDIRINTRRLTISGNTITPKDYQVNFIPGGAKYTVNEQLIYKVIGYK